MAWRRRWRSCARPNRSAGTRVVTEEMTRYYARRAAEYERVYEIPAWQPALAELRRRVPALFAGRSVFEVACGTGYWTAHVAITALGVRAPGVYEESLALASHRSRPHGDAALRGLD